MNSTPRSVLKKRQGVHDDRRVSFASPLSYEKEAPSKKKSLPIAVPSAAPVAKKSRPASDLTDIVTLGNKQSDIIESIFDVESKFSKQSAMTHEMTNNLLALADSVASQSSESRKIQAQLADRSEKIKEAKEQRKKLLEHVNVVCKQYEDRFAAESRYSSGVSELQKAIAAVNCIRLDNLDGVHVDYDYLLTLVDKLEIYSTEF